MSIICHLILLFLGSAFTQESQPRDGLTEASHPKWDQIQSPMLEVLLPLPSSFRNVKSFKRSLGVKPEKYETKTEFENPRTIVGVRSYEIAQPAEKTRRIHKRGKRESITEKTELSLETPETEKLVSSSLVDPEPRKKYPDPSPDDMLPVPDAIRGSFYRPYPVKEFDVVDMNDPDDPRRRRNESVDGGDDNSQRDKRTFSEGEGENGETTTPSPFWKRKKENPPFITGRGGSIQNANGYTPPQHRSLENARESHSIKNLDKTVQSNEISRSKQDNYYASTNRRTYSRQSDSVTPSTPKSVYDTIDYSSHKRNQNGGRSGRIYEGLKDGRDGRLTHEQYNNRPFQFNHPAVYDRPYYQPPYPYPTEVIGRGIEYYHRTYEPSTGRIIYYANVPEPGRSFDYRFLNPINRSFYVNRPIMYDPYYRNYIPPYDYRFQNAYGRSMDYMRTGRSSSQSYAYPQSYQERESNSRDARFIGAFDKSNRLKDDLRNKTYIIYDADDSQSQFPRPLPSDASRFGYTSAPNPGVQVPFRQYPFPPPADYFQPFPFRNQFYPSSPGPFWGYNQRSSSGITDSGLNSRPLNSPEVQLPLTTSNRSLYPSADAADKSKQSK